MILECDEQQNAAERGVGDLTQQRGAERQQHDHDRYRGEAGDLGSSAGFGNHRRARRAGIDGKRADQARQDTADADADEIAVDIRRLVGIGRKGPRRRRRLHHNDNRNDQTERHQARQVSGRDDRDRKRRHPDRDRAENADAPALKPEQHHGRARQRKADQRAGNPRIDLLGQGDDRQNSEADHKRECVCLAEMFGEGRDALQDGALGRGQAEYHRQLRNQDMDRNPGEKADRHGYREQVGDPAQAENSGGEEQKSDHQRECCGQRQVIRRAGHSQSGKASGKNRCDRRICAARQEAVAAERREGQRAGQKGEKADLRGEPAEPRGRHLFRDRDRGKRKACKQIVAEELKAIPTEGAEHRPGSACARRIRRAGRLHHHPLSP